MPCLAPMASSRPARVSGTSWRACGVCGAPTPTWRSALKHARADAIRAGAAGDYSRAAIMAMAGRRRIRQAASRLVALDAYRGSTLPVGALTILTQAQRSGAGQSASGSAVALELGHLGVGPADPLLRRPTINKHSGLLYADDPAQTVPVVGHQVLHRELLDNRAARPSFLIAPPPTPP